ncbi:MAG: dynamin family protein [Clostridia bacterium]|nr:dynamin family protein [Clostridia bacterium]
MNDFLLYHNLCNLYSQLEPYAADQQLYVELKSLTDQFSAKTYRVAVIGEFKRGKSSLINALLGTEILPTDILPTTAVINRIKYSVDQKIVIYFKNGEVKESTIDSLAEYATKLDKEKEQFAETIREIVVHYPSVFGQNHIELIDTPGLNDNESMTETTLNVLGNIDTALVVISATMPLSMTEQNLICDLIKQTDIYNLAFAVTFIDRVSDDEEDQDRVVELIENRLSKDTFEYFCGMVENEALIKKAKRILSQPNVYAVSSRQAIQGFIKGRNDLIEKSRFKHFKYNLHALLTANQEKDRLLKIQRISSELETQLPEWIDKYIQHTKADIKAAEERCAVLQRLYDSSQKDLNERLLKLEDAAKNQKDMIISELTNGTDINKFLKRLFITELSALRRSEFCEEVLRTAIQSSCTKANEFLAAAGGKIIFESDKLSRRAFEELEAHYKTALGESNNSSTAISYPNDAEDYVFKPRLSQDLILGKMVDIFDECMPHITKAVEEILEQFYSNIENYSASRRGLMKGYYEKIDPVLKDAIDLLVNEIAVKKTKFDDERGVAVNEQAEITATIKNINGITG